MSSLPVVQDDGIGRLGAVVTAEVIKRVLGGKTQNRLGATGLSVDGRNVDVAVELLESVELLDQVGDFHDARMACFVIKVNKKGPLSGAFVISQ